MIIRLLVLQLLLLGLLIRLAVWACRAASAALRPVLASAFVMFALSNTAFTTMRPPDGNGQAAPQAKRGHAVNGQHVAEPGSKMRRHTDRNGHSD